MNYESISALDEDVHIQSVFDIPAFIKQLSNDIQYLNKQCHSFAVAHGCSLHAIVYLVDKLNFAVTADIIHATLQTKNKLLLKYFLKHAAHHDVHGIHLVPLLQKSSSNIDALPECKKTHRQRYLI